MSWAASRVATRPEDIAYSLLGIFGVNIPLLYGEGKAAFRRSQEEILKHTEDDSFLLFANTTMGILADSPRDFACHLPQFSDEEKLSAMTRQEIEVPSQPFCAIAAPETLSLSHAGLHIQRPMFRWDHNVYLVRLRTSIVGRQSDFRAHIFAEYNESTCRFERMPYRDEAFRYLPTEWTRVADTEKSWRLNKGAILPQPLYFDSSQVIGAGRPAITTTYTIPHMRIDNCLVEVAFTSDRHSLTIEEKLLRLCDVLAHLCWHNPKSTIAIAGSYQFEAQAMLRMVRNRKAYYLHIGLNAAGVP